MTSLPCLMGALDCPHRLCEWRVPPAPQRVPACLQPVFRSGAGSRVSMLRTPFPQPLPLLVQAGALWPCIGPSGPGKHSLGLVLSWSETDRFLSCWSISSSVETFVLDIEMMTLFLFLSFLHPCCSTIHPERFCFLLNNQDSYLQEGR